MNVTESMCTPRSIACGSLPMIATMMAERSGDLNHQATREPSTRIAHRTVELSVAPTVPGEVFSSGHTPNEVGMRCSRIAKKSSDDPLAGSPASGSICVFLDYLEIPVAEE